MCSYYKTIFIVLFKYEYARLLKIEQPTSEDVRKMMAVQKKWQDDIELTYERIIRKND